MVVLGNSEWSMTDLDVTNEELNKIIMRINIGKIKLQIIHSSHWVHKVSLNEQIEWVNVLNICDLLLSRLEEQNIRRAMTEICLICLKIHFWHRSKYQS